MFYYRFRNEERFGTSNIPIDENDPLIEAVSEAEYLSEIAKINADAEEPTAAESDKDARIAELEAENAALLFQILTGEIYADV